MIEFILGALLALLVFKLGQWYQKHRWLTEMVEDTEHWQKLINVIKYEKSKLTPEERATFEKPKENTQTRPEPREPLHVEKHGTSYYAFTFSGDEFIAQAPSLEDLAQEVERRRPGRFNVGTQTN